MHAGGSLRGVHALRGGGSIPIKSTDSEVRSRDMALRVVMKIRIDYE